MGELWEHERNQEGFLVLIPITEHHTQQCLACCYITKVLLRGHHYRTLNNSPYSFSQLSFILQSTFLQNSRASFIYNDLEVIFFQSDNILYGSRTYFSSPIYESIKASCNGYLLKLKLIQLKTSNHAFQSTYDLYNMKFQALPSLDIIFLNQLLPQHYLALHL